MLTNGRFYQIVKICVWLCLNNLDTSPGHFLKYPPLTHVDTRQLVVQEEMGQMRGRYRFKGMWQSVQNCPIF